MKMFRKSSKNFFSNSFYAHVLRIVIPVPKIQERNCTQTRLRIDKCLRDRAFSRTLPHPARATRSTGRFEFNTSPTSQDCMTNLYETADCLDIKQGTLIRSAIAEADLTGTLIKKARMPNLTSRDVDLSYSSFEKKSFGEDRLQGSRFSRRKRQATSMARQSMATYRTARAEQASAVAANVMVSLEDARHRGHARGSRPGDC